MKANMGETKEKVVYADVDTEGQYIVNDLSLYGRKEIVLDCAIKDFEADPLSFFVKNIGKISSIHKQNANDCKRLFDNYVGKQDILNKVRANGDTKINNKVVMPLAWEFVTFKKGYYVGKPIKYVNNDDNKNEEENNTFLNYIEASEKASKDIEKYENLLVTGIAYTMTIPKRQDYDETEESPFEYIVLDNAKTCVVRSSEVGKPIIFSMCISNINDERGTYTLYTLYWKNKSCIIKGDGNEYSYYQDIKLEPIDNCITEYALNPLKIGVFEVLINVLNNLNSIRSLQLDQIEEFVNSYIVFENVDTKQVKDNIDDFRTKRFIAIKSTSSQVPAKVNSISIQLDHTPINNLYDDMEQRAFDIAGVPMATSNTGQGVSGEAQVFGGGWENAQAISSIDTTFTMKSEKEDLRKMIKICKNAPNGALKSLKSIFFKIKYTINKSNNMMVKSQSMKYYVDSGFTRTQALDFCEITDDPQTQGKIADENAIANEQRLLQNEITKSNSTIVNNQQNEE